jgi:hypothetical protein
MRCFIVLVLLNYIIMLVYSVGYIIVIRNDTQSTKCQIGYKCCNIRQSKVTHIVILFHYISPSKSGDKITLFILLS